MRGANSFRVPTATSGFRDVTMGRSLPLRKTGAAMAQFPLISKTCRCFAGSTPNDLSRASASTGGTVDSPNCALHYHDLQHHAPGGHRRGRLSLSDEASSGWEEPEDVTGAVLFLTIDDAAFIYRPGDCRRRRSVSDRLGFWRTEERKLDQRRMERVLGLGDRNSQKFRADFRREVHQNSKNKTVAG